MFDVSKKEQGIGFLKKYLHLFQCPVCAQPFQEVKEGSVYCTNSHTFDVSKKGTVHFLLKQSKNEYGKDMLQSRYEMMAAGLFDGILDEVYELIDQKDGVTLDVGCGEGSHLDALHRKGLNGPLIGFDISKDAIQLAAAHFTSAFWCVADLAQSPFSKAQFDTLLNLFSPSNYEEFSRLLKQEGQLIKVIPGEHHLREIRQVLYSGDEQNESYSNEPVFENFQRHYPDYVMKPVTYTFDVSKERVGDLVRMTPLSWNASVEQLKTLESRLTSITIDSVVLSSKSI